MSEASFASLGPTLLARKGGAKPAMRPQLAPLPEDPADAAAIAEEALEDLGWNDMGTEAHEGADIVSLTPHAANEDILDGTAESPIVRRQQKTLAERVLADAAMGSDSAIEEEDDEFDDEPMEEETIDEVVASEQPQQPVVAKTKAKAAARPSGKSAAFTLRLDTDRHLKLRLASTMQGVSAQALVTEALDALLEQIEDLDALVERMKRN